MGRGVNSATGRHSQSSGKGRANASNRPRQTTKVSPLRWAGWVLAFGSVITVSATLGATLALLTPFQVTPQANRSQGATVGDFLKTGFQYGISRPVNILVMGVDRVPDAPEGSAAAFESRSDTMLLVRLNPETGKVNLLTIPRDTQIDLPELGRTKINHANWKGGPSLAAAAVSDLLNGVSVDRYVRVSTGAFREIIDLVGGVEVYVPFDMQYTDETQKLYIDLKAGQQTLNGTQAEGFVRFRHNELGDIGRTQRQQMLVKALQKRFQNPLMLARLPQVFSVLQKNIDTNLSLGEMLALVQFGMQIKPDDLQMVLLPGRFSSLEEFELSYWLMDPAGMDQVMSSYFDVEPPFGAATPSSDVTGLQLFIQNASKDPDGSLLMYDYLQQMGFYNISIDEDWPENLRDSQVVPQWGNLQAAEQIQGMIPKSKVAADSTGNLQSDITVRVGRNWVKQYRAKSKQQPDAYKNEDRGWP